MSFKIGNLEIKNKVILAPMAGVSNAAFRKIAINNGAGLCYAEMVSDKGLFFDNEKTKNLLKNDKEAHPYAQQIFGSDIKSMMHAAKYVNDNTDADIIDINMGCPVPKVAQRAQAGAALLKDPNKVYEIVKAVKSVITKPLSVKIRSGWDNNSINAVEIAKQIEKAGADVIVIHGRTRSQLYSGRVDLEIIKQVKESVNIPVIGNGDIVDGPTALKMLDYTGVDAIMIGRAALGNPWIFKEINYYLANKKEFPRPSNDEVEETLCNHYEHLIKLKGEHLATLEIRSQGTWYFKGMPQAKETRVKMSKVENKEEFYEIVNSYFSSLI